MQSVYLHMNQSWWSSLKRQEQSCPQKNTLKIRVFSLLNTLKLRVQEAKTSQWLHDLIKGEAISGSKTVVFLVISTVKMPHQQREMVQVSWVFVQIFRKTEWIWFRSKVQLSRAATFKRFWDKTLPDLGHVLTGDHNMTRFFSSLSHKLRSIVA